MKKPKTDEKRATIYVVTTMDHSAGTYVGETDSHVVLRVSDTVIKGFPWNEVEPVTLHETEASSQ